MELLRTLYLWALVTPVALAQNGSIGGTITDSVTGAPLAGFVGLGDKTVFADERGHYKIDDLPPGQYRLLAGPGKGDRGHNVSTRRVITLHLGESMIVDIRLEPLAHVLGKVLDRDDKPVAGVQVRGMVASYWNGNLRYVVDSIAVGSNQNGEYDLQAFALPYIFTATPSEWDPGGNRRVSPISTVAEDPKDRRPVDVPSYYPDALEPEAGLKLTVRPGDTIEHMDIHLRRMASLCVDGKLVGPGGPAGLEFSLVRKAQRLAFVGKTGADGEFRICDAYSGEYQLQAADPQAHLFGVTDIVLTGKDAHNIRVQADIWRETEGEIVLEGPPPEPPLSGKMTLRITREAAPRDEWTLLSVKLAVPGKFSVPMYPQADYRCSASDVPQGWYLKDCAYSGVSFLHGTVQPGSVAGGGGLRVVLARDGGTLSALVTDSDGKPVGDAPVTIFPASTASDGDLAQRMSTGRTDQNGHYQSAMLAPGKYYAVAVEVDPEKPESVARLRSLRNRAAEVTLGDSGTVQVTLEPVDR